MTSKDYKAVQDAQLRYETYVQCRRFDKIVEELLSKGELHYDHSDLPQPAEGREAVLEVFRKAAAAFEENGGFLRTDLASGQVIQFAPDGDHAVGTWLTVGALCEMGAYGKTQAPYPFYRNLGQRRVEFVREEGQWRMTRISWRRITTLGPAAYDPGRCTGWAGVRECRWDLPPSEETRAWEGRHGR